MKRVLILPLFAIVTLVSQAVAAETWTDCTGTNSGYCKWGDNCYAVNTCTGGDSGSDCAKQGTDCAKVYQNCLKNSSSHTVWSNNTCTTVKEKGGIEECGGYCKWATCEAIKTDPDGEYGTATTTCTAAIKNCDDNASRYSDAACTNLVGGRDPNRTALGCCKWDTGTACYTIWSDETGAQGKVSDCQGGNNQFWSGACPGGNGTCPSTNPSNPGSSSSSGNTPIINNHVIQGLTLEVAPFGRSLHISSAREATVSLYDMSGAKVYSGKVRAGNSVFGLEKVPSGSYYAIVQSGSDSKKVSVMLK